MRIAFVVGSNLEQFDSTLLGPNRLEQIASNCSYFNALAKEIKSQNNEVALYLLGTQEKKLTEIRHVDGYPVFLVPSSAKQGHPREFSLELIGVLNRHFSEKRFDLVHFHSYYTRMFNPVALFCAFKGIPLVAQFHGGGLDEGKFAGKIASMILQRTLGLAKAVIVLNSVEKKNLENRGLKNIFLVPYGIDARLFSGVSKRKARKRLGFGEKGTIVLFVGRLLDSHKGLSVLLKAIPLLKTKGAKLLVCGDGPDLKMMKRIVAELQLENMVFFKGWVKGKEKLDCFAASDFLCVPSNPGFEGMPIVALEAMACSKPVIATNCAGLNELVVDGCNGFLVEPKSPVLLAEKIDAFLHSKALLTKMGTNARKTICGGFSSKEIAKRINAIYER